MRNVSHKRCRENQNTRFIFKNSFVNCAVYETMWKTSVEQGRPQMTIWCTHIACWMPKATNTHLEYVILFASLQRWLHECASVLYYLNITCLVLYPLHQQNHHGSI